LGESKKYLGEDITCDLRLKQDARLDISRPKGMLVKKMPRELFKGKLILAVGDAVFKNLFDIGIRPDLCVLDLKVRRQKIEPPAEALKGYIILKTRNPPGWITLESWKTIKDAIQSVTAGQKVAVLVEGEEDLLGFPVAIYAPSGSILIYGQPGEGAVIVRMNEAERKRALRLLERSFECA